MRSKPLSLCGYWQRPDLQKQTFQDGFLITQDLGYLDADGYLYVTGRVDEVINSGGYKYDPAQIEAAIAPFLEGEMLCVFAVPDLSGALGQVPCLVVERAAHQGDAMPLEVVADPLSNHPLKTRLPNPKKAYVISSIPTGTGKIKESC